MTVDYSQIEPIYRSIRAESLTPVQRLNKRNFRTAADFRLQHMIKSAQVCEFHSQAEYLYAALLEADPLVTTYTPQPFLLRVAKKRYTPDFYVQRREPPSQVIELKADPADVSPELEAALNRFFEHELGAQYRVIANQEVFEKFTLADNWHRICRRLHLGRELKTTHLEEEIVTRVVTNPGQTLWDLVVRGDNPSQFDREIAVLRLIHKGALRIDLKEQPLRYDMAVTP